MNELKSKFADWTTFTRTREAARHDLANPEGSQDIKDQIAQKKSELMTIQAELQMLQAQLVLKGTKPYNKSAFDLEWARKKQALKDEVEALMAEQIELGVSIPKIMKEIGTKSPTWLYTVKENLNIIRGASKEDLSHVDWTWSNITSVHRYGIAKELGSDEWSYVLLKGVLDSPLEDQHCTFDFKTGNFIAGSKAVFDSVTQSVKQQRAQMLADIVDGTYTKSVRRDTNPYFDVK